MSILAVVTLFAVAPARALEPVIVIDPTATHTDENLGYSVASAGDFNADGYDDVIVGVPGLYFFSTRRGAARIYYGGPDADANPDLTFLGEAAADSFGFSVASAGDVNGDGYNDVIVGAPGNDANGTRAGRAYVYFGGPLADGIADLVLGDGDVNDRFGYSVASAGDVNHDGYDDLIVGAPYANIDVYDQMGRVYLYLGGNPCNGIADWALVGEVEGDHFGYSVSTAGDLNGDGYDDVIIGAPDNNAGGVDAGRTYVYYGGMPLNDDVDITWTGLHSRAHFGTAVATAGHFHSQSYDDVIIGARGTGTLFHVLGYAYVYYGSAQPGFLPSLAFHEGVYTGFGASVHMAGHINDDGYDDLIVGEPGGDRAHVYFGGSVADAVADVALTGEMSGDQFGHAVATAGAFRPGCGTAVIVGAPENDVGAENAGRAYVYGWATDIAIHTLCVTRFHQECTGTLFTEEPWQVLFTVANVGGCTVSDWSYDVRNRQFTPVLTGSGQRGPTICSSSA